MPVSLMKFISFGKMIQNLSISIDKKIIGSEFTTFEHRIVNGVQILFVCDSRVWGMAEVTSNVFFDQSELWENKLYPYRANIDNIIVFKKTFKFSDFGVDSLLRDRIGRQWAYKVLFTPGDLPDDVVAKLCQITKRLEVLDRSNYKEYFLNNQKEFEYNRRKKLGLI